jgi:hypothetical protein
MGARTFLFIRSNIVGFVALFVALGGSTYAAVKIKNNSVTTKKIRNGAVTKQKLGSDVDAAFLPASSASSFLPASAASNFEPGSSVQRLGLSGVGCVSSQDPGCRDDPIATDVRLSSSCFYSSGAPRLSVDLGSGQNTLGVNFVLQRDGMTNDLDSLAIPPSPPPGSTQLLALATSDNLVGTIFIRNGTGQVITVAFHAFVGAGPSPGTANCVFEGTATTA